MQSIFRILVIWRSKWTPQYASLRSITRNRLEVDLVKSVKSFCWVCVALSRKELSPERSTNTHQLWSSDSTSSGRPSTQLLLPLPPSSPLLHPHSKLLTNLFCRMNLSHAFPSLLYQSNHSPAFGRVIRMTLINKQITQTIRSLIVDILLL